jgi:hypothetical protein
MENPPKFSSSCGRELDTIFAAHPLPGHPDQTDSTQGKRGEFHALAHPAENGGKPILGKPWPSRGQGPSFLAEWAF